MRFLNERMIVPVFRELVASKPKLALLLPDDDEDDEVDIRQLAAEIIRSFPWPLGVELRRLFSAGLHELNRGRLAQLLEEGQQRDLRLAGDLRHNFARRFSVPSLGTYMPHSL